MSAPGENWVELRLRSRADLQALYDWLAENDSWIIRCHHFWDEPWWPNAYVVRVLSVGGVDYSECSEVNHYEPWDPTPDEKLFGESWPQAQRFLEASSALASDTALNAKLVHCFLNARGMSPRDEARFALRFLWNRLTIGIRWRLYLRRRWEHEQKRRRAEALVEAA